MSRKSTILAPCWETRTRTEVERASLHTHHWNWEAVSLVRGGECEIVSSGSGLQGVEKKHT